MPPLTQQKLYTPLAQRNAMYTKSLGGGTDLEAVKRGISYVETRGNPNAYALKGVPVTSGMYAGDRALGKYQVMGKNVAPWTKQYLGREYTPEEYLANPDIQEKLADARMGELLQQYGNPEDVASVWFTGRPLAKAGGAPKDDTGTSNATYQDLFKKGMAMGGTVGQAYQSATQGLQSFGAGLAKATKLYTPLALRTAQGIPQAAGELAVSSAQKTGQGLGMIMDSITPKEEDYPAVVLPSGKELPRLDPTGVIGSTGRIGGAFAENAPKAFEGFQDLSTKLLEKLKGRSTVSKQFISDLTNSPDLKQAEKDLVRKALEDAGDEINVPDFANRVKSELLPLTTKSTKQEQIGRAKARAELKKLGIKIEKDMDGGGYPVDKNGEYLEYDEMDEGTRRLLDAALGDAQSYQEAITPGRYENINLPDELRGPVANYYENIYESPISTSAGGVHFGSDSKNYFAHSRIEDLPDNASRRVIELQSDLFQKGRLEQEYKSGGSLGMNPKEYMDVMVKQDAFVDGAQKQKFIKDWTEKIKVYDKDMAEIAKLEPYRNTWHERVIREEVKQAAKDGKTKLQFPTGETAMKIEGLGDNTQWFKSVKRDADYDIDLANSPKLTANDLKVGQEVNQSGNSSWIITDVLGDGKFKAVPKRYVDLGAKNWKYEIDESMVAEGGNPAWVAINEVTGQRDFVPFTPSKKEQALEFLKSKVSDTPLEDLAERYGETFDISGKVDTENPIYKFYEKTVAKYLTNKYGGKVVTDPQGVKWVEIDVKPEYKGLPVEAFGALALPAVPQLSPQGNESKER